MDYLIFSCSLKPTSLSRIMAKEMHKIFDEKKLSVDFVDLTNFPLPMCDGDTAYHDLHVAELRGKIHAAKGIVIAAPIYNYDISASTKNLIELTGSAWKEKVVGFVCAAGGRSSFMSVMGLANSLMLDFKCIIVPRFVYATEAAFTSHKLSDAKIHERLDDLAQNLIRVSAALTQ